MMEKILQQILEGQNNIKCQLDENTQIIKALIHRTDQLDAKYDSLLHTTATRDSIDDLKTIAIDTKDSIAVVNAKIDLIESRLFQQETKLRLIEIAK